MPTPAEFFSDIDATLKTLPDGWRFTVGHVAHWYSRDSIPKHLRKKPFEAYVTNGESIGTSHFIFESADAGTPAEALRLAITAAVSAKARQDSALQKE